MNSKRRWSALALLIVLALLLAGCQGPAPTQPAPTQVPAEKPAAKELKVALVLSGPISDASWNAAAYNAVLGLKDKFNIKLEYSENVDLPNIEPTYRGYASQGFDIIIGHGFQFGDPAVKLSKDYPDTKWGIVMGVVEAPNVVSLNFREEETSYIAGYVAAKLSKSHVIGGVGGQQVPSIIKMMEALKLGAKAADPTTKVLVTYTGTWTDPTAGYEAALAQINQGADVLFPAANLTSTGVYKAAKEKGVRAIGSEGDQCAAAPGAVVASITDSLPRILEIMMQSVADGTYKGGLGFYGLKEDAIGFVPCKGVLPSDLETKAADLTKQIVDGSLKVPEILEPTE